MLLVLPPLFIFRPRSFEHCLRGVSGLVRRYGAGNIGNFAELLLGDVFSRAGINTSTKKKEFYAWQGPCSCVCQPYP